MNGAELPCGNTIGVQPADANYKTKSIENNEDQSSRRQLSPSNGAVPMDSTNETGEPTNATSEIALSAVEISERSQEMDVKILQNEGDDLDDFFASLE
jgi:hypothetical protein